MLRERQSSEIERELLMVDCGPQLAVCAFKASEFPTLECRFESHRKLVKAGLKMPDHLAERDRFHRAGQRPRAGLANRTLQSKKSPHLRFRRQLLRGCFECCRAI